MFDLVQSAQERGERIGQEVSAATVSGNGLSPTPCKIGLLTFHEQIHAGGGGLDLIRTMDVAVLRRDVGTATFTRGQALTITRRLAGGRSESVQLEVGDMNMDDATAIYLNLVRPIV